IRDRNVTGVQTCALPILTRKELIAGVGQRYRTSGGADKSKILEEFVRLTGYHRKHALRVLNCSVAKPKERRRRERIYDDAVRQRSEERRVGKEVRARWGR